MATEIIDHATLTKLAEDGVVRSAQVVGQDGGWGILVKYGTTERALAAQSSQQVRIFQKLETLVQYLKGIGILRFEVDAVNYAEQTDSAKIPDRDVKTEDAHAASTYTEWLKAEVQDAIDDTSPTIAHEEAIRQVRAALKLA